MVLETDLGSLFLTASHSYHFMSGFWILPQNPICGYEAAFWTWHLFMISPDFDSGLPFMVFSSDIYIFWFWILICFHSSNKCPSLIYLFLIWEQREGWIQGTAIQPNSVGSLKDTVERNKGSWNGNNRWITEELGVTGK